MSLNSNLILLIHFLTILTTLTCFSLNSNLILLIPTLAHNRQGVIVLFKFQSDSINTMIELTGQVIVYTLNSNLILLIQQEATKQ